MDAVVHKLAKPDRGSPENDADLMFFCPGCKCGHGVWTTKKNGAGAVWTFNGNMEKPTFQPSLKIEYPHFEPPVTPENQEQFRLNPWPQTKVVSICHSNVTDGMITFHGDSTHALSGKTVPLEPF